MATVCLYVKIYYIKYKINYVKQNTFFSRVKHYMFKVWITLLNIYKPTSWNHIKHVFTVLIVWITNEKL